MPVCSFCKKRFKEPRGLVIFTFDGRSVNYCSSKCRRNAALGRDGRKMNWVKKSPYYMAAVKEEQEEDIEKQK